jgi:hypothetical protein
MTLKRERKKKSAMCVFGKIIWRWMKIWEANETSSKLYGLNFYKVIG